MPRKSTVDVDGILIEKLARGESQTSAAAAAGVGRKTVFLRLKKPAFRKAVEDFRANLLDEAVGKLAAGIGKAIDRLGHLVEHATPQMAAQVTAAKSYVELTIRFKELHLESRMTDLQTRLEAMEENRMDGHRP